MNPVVRSLFRVKTEKSSRTLQDSKASYRRDLGGLPSDTFFSREEKTDTYTTRLQSCQLFSVKTCNFDNKTQIVEGNSSGGSYPQCIGVRAELSGPHLNRPQAPSPAQSPRTTYRVEDRVKQTETIWQSSGTSNSSNLRQQRRHVLTTAPSHV